VEQKFRPEGTTVPPRWNHDHPQNPTASSDSTFLKTELKTEINTTSYKQEKYFKNRREPILTNEEMDRYIKSQGDDYA